MKKTTYKGYQVLSDGRVYKKRGNGFMKPTMDNNGYYVSKFGTKCLWHRFIWEAFNGQIPKGMTIDHIDGNKMNNSLYNLRLVTRAKNTSLAQIKNRKLSESDVLSALDFRTKGYTYMSLAKMFNVDYKTMYRIINNKGYYGSH